MWRRRGGRAVPALMNGVDEGGGPDVAAGLKARIVPVSLRADSRRRGMQD
jgi:hypothetical protein